MHTTSTFRRYTLYSATMETMHHGNGLDGRLAYRTLTGRCTPSVQAVYSVHSLTIGVPVLFYSYADERLNINRKMDRVF